MGRMLEAMKRVVSPASLEETSAAEAVAPAPGEPEVAPADADSEEVPFIEVGSRDKTVDASASVLTAARPKAAPFAMRTDPERRLDPASPRPSLLAEGGQRGFVFQAGKPLSRASTSRIAPEIIAYYEDSHPVSEQYRALRAKIQDIMAGTESPVLLFTALTPGAGTTTTLLNLAVTHCRHGKQRVVVVDAHLARPALAKRLGLVQATGLAEVLNGTAALEEALAASPQPGLHVLAANSRGSEGRLLGEENLRWLAARLRERFDVVLLDSPAWGSCNDTAALAAVADAVFLVLDASDADTPAVRQVTRTLAQRGWRLGGMILGNQGA